MRTWKIILAGTILSAAAIVAIAPHGTDASVRAGSNTFASRDIDPDNSIVPEPMAPPPAAIDDKRGSAPTRSVAA
jgi:hypothetical protein